MEPVPGKEMTEATKPAIEVVVARPVTVVHSVTPVSEPALAWSDGLGK